MNGKLDNFDRFAVAIVGASGILTALVFDRLPDPFPTHFDARGAANGWMPRATGAFLLPIAALLIWVSVRFGGRLMPRAWRERLDASPVSAVGLLVTGLLGAVHVLVLRAAMEPVPHLGAGVWVMLGFFLVLLGQVLPRVRRNPIIGIRTTWALTSDENWARTHRFAGYAMTFGGLLGILATLASVPWLGVVFLLGGSLAPVAYSWSLARST